MHRVTVETLKQGYAAEVVQSSKLMARLTTITKPGVDNGAFAARLNRVPLVFTPARTWSPRQSGWGFQIAPARLLSAI
jgi:hypothetical protein